MSTNWIAVLPVATVLLGGAAEAQTRAYASVTEFAKKELGMPLAGLGLHLSMSPETSGKGRWDSRLQQLVIDHPLRNRPLVAETALRKLGEHCRSRGGTLEHDLRAVFRNSEGKEIIFGRSPRMGVHSCKTADRTLFTLAVTTSPRTKTSFTGLNGAVEQDPYEPIDYTLRIREGDFTEARQAFAEVVKDQAAQHEAGLVELARSNAASAELGEAAEAFRAGLKAGDNARHRGRSAPVLVVEVKSPLALVQPVGEPAAWVRLNELSPQ